MAAAEVVTKMRVYISRYNCEEPAEVVSQLIASLANDFDVVTEEHLPIGDEESVDEWNARKAHTVDVVLVLMCNEYMDDELCKEELIAAMKERKDSGKPRILFVKVDANFVENEWLKQARGKAVPTDLTGSLYNRNIKTLTKRIQGITHVQNSRYLI